jgi:hypothetical protein
MRYYDLTKEGKVRGSYAVPQPGLERDGGPVELILLEDAPNDESKWDGRNWIPDQDKIDIRLSSEAKQKLKEIDLASIRSIREYLSKQENASEFLKNLETQAIIEREKIKV